MAREKGMGSLQLEKTGGGGQRREVSEQRDSPLRQGYGGQENVTSPLALNATLTPEMLGELRKMYEVLRGVFGENGIMRI